MNIDRGLERTSELNQPHANYSVYVIQTHLSHVLRTHAYSSVLATARLSADEDMHASLTHDT